MVQVTIDRTETDAASGEKENPKHWKPRRRLAIAGGVFSLLVLVALLLLPQILSTTTIKQRIVQSLMKEYEGTLEIDNADLAWWKNAQISGVTVRDEQGGELAKIESAEVTTPLWKLLWGGRKELELKLKGPHLFYEVNAYGVTNWEKVFGKDTDSSFSWPSLEHRSQPTRLKIVDGKVTVRDNVTKRYFEADNIQIQLKKSSELLSGTLTSDTRLSTADAQKEPAGHVLADFQLAMAGNKVRSGEVDGQIEKTPLELLQPWIRQLLPHLTVSASRADGNFKTKWTGTLSKGFKLAFDGTLTAKDFRMTSTKWLPERELQTSEFSGTIEIDNTLPTAPGEYALDCQMKETLIRPLRVRLKAPLQALPDKAAELKETVIGPEMPEIPLGPVRLKSTGTVGPAATSVDLKTCLLSTGSSRIEMAGNVKNVGHHTRLDLEGTGQGDVYGLLQLIAPDVYQVMDVKQLQMKEFAVRGDLPKANRNPRDKQHSSESLENTTANSPEGSDKPPEIKPFAAVAEWQWEELSCYGVTSGKGKFWTNFSDDRLKIVPVDVQIGERGQFHATTTIEFRDEGNLLTLEKGQVLENVEFTEAMCRGWLKYISPVFANATDVNGRFSLSMDQLQVNLDQGVPEKLKGTLQIQESRLGPGPIIQRATAPVMAFAGQGGKAAEFLKDGAKWLELPPQNVGFLRREDRIYHDQLTFVSGKVTVKSTGSVGLDRTLDILIQIPLNLLPDKTGPLAQFLRNQPINIQVQGTFDEPEISGTELKQFGAGAINGLLRGLLDRRRPRN